MSDTYYDHDGIAIYHADNTDVEWPTPESVGLLLTDPPYGIDYEMSTAGSVKRWNGRGVNGDDTPFDPRPLLVFPRAIIFGANYFSDLLPVGGWVIWSKSYRPGGSEVRDAGRFVSTSSAEVAWNNCDRRVHVFNHWWAAGGFLHRESERGETLHPTQKPAALMRWIVDKWTEPGDLVFDPYMGSGPIARACLDLGRRYVGIEIVEEYCQTAVNRLGQLALALEDV